MVLVAGIEGRGRAVFELRDPSGRGILQIEGIVAKQQQENAQSILNYLAANVPSDFAQTRRTFQLKALILIHEDAESFVHSHPTDQTASAGELRFLARLPKPGQYRGWLQFQQDGKVLTHDVQVRGRE